MKKYVYPLLLVLISTTYLRSQSLSNWKHYYAANFNNYYFYDTGNFLYDYLGGELLKFNKSTYAVTRIPVPEPLQKLTTHNTLFYDSYQMAIVPHMPFLQYGPDNSMLLRTQALNTVYEYDGSNWTTPSNYLSFSMDSISFFKKNGPSNIFADRYKLYKYDGTTLNTYDSLNSPYYPTSYSTLKSSSFDDIAFFYADAINIQHSGSWATYSKTFFNISFLNPSVIGVNSSGDFSFVNNPDLKVRTLVRASNSWITSAQIPVSMRHDGASSAVQFTCYDSNEDLWLFGQGVFCRYSGNQFVDYYSASIATISSVPSYPIHLSGSTFLTYDYEIAYAYDPVSNIAHQVIDPQAVLTGNELLPSLKDSSGNIWLGVAGYGTKNGLMKFDGTSWTAPDLQAHQLYFEEIHYLTLDSSNSVLFSTAPFPNGGPMYIHDTVINHFFNGTSSTLRVCDVAADKNHHYWVAPNSGNGIMEYFDSTYTFHSSPNTGLSGAIAIEIDSLSAKWICFQNHDGVYKYDGSWTSFNKANSALPNDTVVDILKEPNTNAVWFCTSNGFARYYNGNWSILNKSNSPLPDNHAEYVYFGNDSTTWFATQGGFASLRNNLWNVYTVDNSPLMHNDIESMVIDNNCTLYLCNESGLVTASLGCSATTQKIVQGTLRKSDNSYAVGALVYVHKLNATSTDIEQIDNTFTDASGNFTYYTSESGHYYFSVEQNEILLPSQLMVYTDSSLVMQDAPPLTLSSNGTYLVNLKMRQTSPSPGQLTFLGQLQSQTERVGGVRLLLLLNNQPVASEYSNADGSFQFKNLAAAAYTIWVDKMGLDNSLAPSFSVNLGNQNTRVFFNLFSSYLALSPLSIVDQANDSMISIYPNPTSGLLTVRSLTPSLKGYSCTLKSILGKTIFSSTSAESNLEVNISGIPSGMYFIEVNADGKRMMKKVVKE